MHIFYAIILSGIILTEVILILIYFIYQSTFQSKLIKHLQDSISLYYVGKSNPNTMPINSISLAWEFTQYYLHCCGAIGQKDYLNAQHWNRTDPYGSHQMLMVPYTCCPLGVMENLHSIPKNLSVAVACATTGVNVYTIGCYDRLLDILNAYKKPFIIGIVVIVVMQILAFLLSIYIYRRRKQFNTL